MGQIMNTISMWFAQVLIYIHLNMGLNWGLSIIILTVLIKILLFPTSISQIRSMEGMKRIQPILKEIQTKYKDKPQEYQQKTMEIYKKHGVNPMGGCLPMLLQFPILIALYSLLRDPAKIFNLMVKSKLLTHATVGILKNSFNSEVFLGMKLTDAKVFTNMNVKGILHVEPSHVIPFLILVALSGITTFLLQKLSSPSTNAGSETEQSMQSMMMYMMPAVLTYFTYSLPAGLGLYWVASNVFSIIQQLVITRYFIPKNPIPTKTSE